MEDEIEPLARVELLVLHVPPTPQDLLVSWARPNHGPGPFSVRVSPPRAILVVDGVGRGQFDVPAGVPIHFLVTVGGLEVSTVDRRIVLDPGETRELAVDLLELCAVEGRLVGVPVSAGRKLVLRYCNEFESALGPRPSVDSRWIRVNAGEDGAFRFPSVPGGACSLRLRTAVGEVALAERSTGAESWSACRTGALIVEPVEPLLGVSIVDEFGASRSDESFSVVLDGSTRYDPWRHPDGLALVRLSDVTTSTHVGAYVPGRGVFRVPVESLRLEPGGVVEIPVPDGPPPGGKIRIDTGEAPPPELSLDFRLHAEKGLEPLIPMQVARVAGDADGLSIQRLDDGLLLRGLPEGRYELSWYWDGGGRRLLESSVEVVDGRETILQVQPPVLRRLEGLVASWESIPRDLQPGRVSLEGYVARISDGRFSVHLLEPIPDRAWVRGPGSHVWRRQLSVARHEGKLVLEYPYESLERVRLVAQPVLGGRIVAEVFEPGGPAEPGDPAGPPFLWSTTSYVQPEDDGFPAIVFAPGERCAGWVREIADGHQVLRGWFEVGAGSTPSVHDFDGRWVPLRFDHPDQLVQVRLEGPALSSGSLPPVLIATVDSTHATELWIPDRAQVVVVRTAAGLERRVEYSASAGSLEISLR